MKFGKKCAGFTLIELSIVLVIIGLLIGGVMVGRELIKVGEIRQAIGDIDKISTAINIFKNKYNCLPGDCGNASSFFPDCAANAWYRSGAWRSNCNGNGNGQIGDSNVLVSTAGAESYMRVWEHLTKANLMTGGTGDWGNYVAPVPGTNVPVYPWAQNNLDTRGTAGNSIISGIVYQYYCPAYFWNGCEDFQTDRDYSKGGGHRLVFQKADPSTGAAWGEGFRSDFVRSLDQKMDDGKPLTGKIKTFLHLGYGNEFCTNGVNNLSQDYFVNSGKPYCSFAAEMPF